MMIEFVVELPKACRKSHLLFHLIEFEVFLKFTRRGGHAIELVEDLVEHDLDYLIGVGGDG